MSGDVVTESGRDRAQCASVGLGGEAPGGSSRIFISYRREETAFPAGWLYDRLNDRFGEGQVFKDVDSITLGDDFVEVITRAVGACDVLLAVIGGQWSTMTDETGKRRLDDRDDFVRLEIEAALARNVRVIPVLVDGARMPRLEELPPSMSGLVRRQALELSPSRFEDDTKLLVRVLDSTLVEMRTEQRVGTVDNPRGASESSELAVPLPDRSPSGTNRARRGSSRLPIVTSIVLAAVVLALTVALVARARSDTGDASETTGGIALDVDASPLTSQHGLELSALRTEPTSAPAVGRTLTVRYALTNGSAEPLQLGYTFVAVRDPAGGNRDAEDSNEGVVVAPGQTVTAEGRVNLASEGTWRVWPCYVLASGDFCPDQWQVIYVPVDDADG